MHSSENIIWIKNVKRNKGDGWAYDDVNCGSTFWLNWPTAKRGSALTPNVGDIIVLFQKPNTINGQRNYDVHFTHLVSPVTSIIHTDNEHPEHMWCREVELIAKANPISAIPNPGFYNFFLPNRGLTNPLINLKNNIGLSEAETKEDIWRMFDKYFCPDIKNQVFLSQEQNGIFGEVEGDKIMEQHVRQELTRRNTKIVQLAKLQALNTNNGRLKCECCNFDFLKTYGNIGSNFIECHHKIHIATGERITRIEDLSLVCSNCHRMLHRKLDSGDYHTIDTLKQTINTSSNKD
ncbi:MAG: HNH endonuclease [Ignavibacteria bacterium]|nr:HNH endonuclease [Ignavibacteria bacterium]